MDASHPARPMSPGLGTVVKGGIERLGHGVSRVWERRPSIMGRQQTTGSMDFMSPELARKLAV